MTLRKSEKQCILDRLDKLEQLQSDMIRLSKQAFFAWLEVTTRWIFEITIGIIRKVTLWVRSMFFYEVNYSEYIFKSIGWHHSLSFAMSAY
jgi:hypothetical protein